MYSEYLKSILSPIPYVYEDFLPTKNIPKEYVVFSVGISNIKNFGDGKVINNQPLCQIDVLSNGIANKELANQVEQILEQNNINANRINLGYLEDIKKTQVAFDFYLNL